MVSGFPYVRGLTYNYKCSIGLRTHRTKPKHDTNQPVTVYDILCKVQFNGVRVIDPGLPPGALRSRASSPRPIPTPQ